MLAAVAGGGKDIGTAQLVGKIAEVLLSPLG